MLATTNRTITVSRLTTGGVRVFTPVIVGLPVYINSMSANVEISFEAGSVKMLRMMTTGDHAEIIIGDRVSDDQGKTYEVTGSQFFDDLTGKHGQYTLSLKNG